jgi:integrase
MRKERPKRRPRKGVERGIYTETDAQGRTRYGLSYAALYDNGGIRNKRELLPPDVKTLGAARKELRARRTDTDRGHLVHAATKAPTFAEFSADFVASRAPEIPASIERVKMAIAEACKGFGGVAIDKVEPRHIMAFKTRRLEACAPGTVKRDLTVLHALFRAAVRVYKVRKDNPCEAVRVGKYQEKPRRVLTLDEERRLIDAAAPHLRPFIVVAIQTGLRLSELRRLEWRDVDFGANVVTLRETKSRKVQTVPLNRIARETLLSLRCAGGPVFTYEGRAFGAPRLGIAAAARRAGIGHVSCHAFRHTCATRLLQAGVDIRTVQAWLRHASIVTTARYLHGADLSDAAEKLAAFSETRPAIAPRV